MDNKVNEISFYVKDYDNNFNDMWDDIKATLKILLKNKNICTIHQEDFDIVVIKYEHHDAFGAIWGSVNPEWLTPDEFEVIEDYRNQQKEEK